MSANHTELEKLLWASADSLRANSRLCSFEYSTPVLGLIFLRFADHKFALAQKEPEQQKATSTSRRRTIGKLDY
jgi:Type I restriction-modification system methyltransferase subunit